MSSSAAAGKSFRGRWYASNGVGGMDKNHTIFPLQGPTQESEEPDFTEISAGGAGEYSLSGSHSMHVPVLWLIYETIY